MVAEGNAHKECSSRWGALADSLPYMPGPGALRSSFGAVLAGELVLARGDSGVETS